MAEARQHGDPAPIPSATATEYSAERRPRRSDGLRVLRPSSRLRFIYFGLAAFWGFVLGVGALAAAGSTKGAGPGLTAEVLVFLLPAALIAVGGGLVAAAAYREARRRLR